mmetsp:Transcript_110721/g.264114  ORF Transcript_110721/g.264114 Transcript_110721/m.264114 type:complete len:294 (+) Transcript_110721:271-1152(+)
MHIATAPHVRHRVQAKEHQEKWPICLHPRGNFGAAGQRPLVGDHSQDVQGHQVGKAVLVPGYHDHLQVREGQQHPAHHAAEVITADDGGQQTQEERAAHVHQNDGGVAQHWSIELDPVGHLLVLEGLRYDVRGVPRVAPHEGGQGCCRQQAPPARHQLRAHTHALACRAVPQRQTQRLRKGRHDQQHHNEEHLEDGVAKVVPPVPASHHVSEEVRQHTHCEYQEQAEDVAPHRRLGYHRRHAAGEVQIWQCPPQAKAHISMSVAHPTAMLEDHAHHCTNAGKVHVPQSARSRW